MCIKKVNMIKAKRGKKSLKEFIHIVKDPCLFQIYFIYICFNLNGESIFIGTNHSARKTNTPDKHSS